MFCLLKDGDKMVCFLDTEKKLDLYNNLFFCSCFLMVEVEKSFVFHCIYVCPEITFEHSVWKPQKKVSFNIASEASYFYI